MIIEIIEKVLQGVLYIVSRPFVWRARRKYIEEHQEYIEQVEKMGSMSKIIDMMPGLAGQISEAQLGQGQEAIKHQKAIIQSMTYKERLNHLIIGPARRKRIAKGSGTSVQEVNKLIKQFEKTKLTMKKLSRNRGAQAKMMNQLAGMDMSQLQNMKLPGGMKLPKGFHF